MELMGSWLQWLSDLLVGLLGTTGLDYLVVFASAFLAATVLPFYSEVFVVTLVLAERDPLLVWVVATVGNTLGAVVNWWLGLGLEQWREAGRVPRWMQIPDREMDRARRWYARFGIWSLLLAWLPVGGDALTFVAGIMRVRLLPFLLLAGFGKGARYGVVIAGALSLLPV